MLLSLRIIPNHDDNLRTKYVTDLPSESWKQGHASFQETCIFPTHWFCVLCYCDGPLLLWILWFCIRCLSELVTPQWDDNFNKIYPCLLVGHLYKLESFPSFQSHCWASVFFLLHLVILWQSASGISG